MLPFDNKSEFQIILNMPEGIVAGSKPPPSPARWPPPSRTEPEVTDYQVYAGIASPYNFNGLVRHYFMRRGANVADIQVNLCPKRERKAQSHDIAKRVRPAVAAIAERYRRARRHRRSAARPAGAANTRRRDLRPDRAGRLKLARKVREIFEHTPGVVDVDWYSEADQQKRPLHHRQGKGRAARHQRRHHFADAENRRRWRDRGSPPPAAEKEDVNMRLELPRAQRRPPGRAAGPARALRRCQRPARARLPTGGPAGAACANW